MKYIRVKKVENKRDGFIIFPRKVTHLGLARQNGYDEVGIISSGFVDLTPEGPVCRGESVGLRCKSMEEDTELLRQQWLEEPAF